MNKAILAKGRWRLLSIEDSIWKSVLKTKYGGGIVINMCGLESMRGVEGDWFMEAFRRKVEDGGKVRFWHDVWVRSQSLWVVFLGFLRCPNKTKMLSKRWTNG
jgi:hypothetical protein